MKKIILSILLLFLFFVSPVCATDYFVAPGGDNTNGLSWATAWQTFGDIVWGSVGGGDTIYISGGNSGVTYEETLSIGADGTNDSTRLVITVGAGHPTLSAGHDGLVTITPVGEEMRGINYNGRDWVTVTGYYSGYSGFTSEKLRVTGTTETGVFSTGSAGIKLFYTHVWRCGDEANEHNVVFVSCTNGSEVSYCNIEEPYQDGVKFNSILDATSFGSMILSHSWVHGMYDDGITGDMSVDIHDNIIGPWGNWVTPPGHPDGMQMYGGYLRIWNNIVYCDDYYASNALIFLNNAFGYNRNPYDHIYVWNNILYTCGDTYSGDHFYGIAFCPQDHGGVTSDYDSDDVRIVNNLIVGTGYYAIGFDSEEIGGGYPQCTNCIVKNNIVYNSDVGGDNPINVDTAWDFANSSFDIDYNVVHAGAAGGDNITFNGTSYTIAAFNSLTATGLVGTSRTNIATEPTFVSYTTGSCSNDYHLHSNDTAAKNQGVDLSALTNMGGNWPADKDGTERPQESVWDVGPYEYTSASPPSLLTATIAANGTTLTLLFSENVSQGVGYNDSDWDLDISGGTQNVGITYSAGDGTTSHTYTIAQTIYIGQTVDIDFNGDTDSMEDDGGYDLAEIDSRSVYNNSEVGDPSAGWISFGETPAGSVTVGDGGSISLE